jgi:hypothetical protein
MTPVVILTQAVIMAQMVIPSEARDLAGPTWILPRARSLASLGMTLPA